MEGAPNRVALVTGASRGIGAAAAIELARRGVHVVITARTQGGLEDTDDAVRALGGTATLLLACYGLVIYLFRPRDRASANQVPNAHSSEIRPGPNTACPQGTTHAFGNSDIYGGSYSDPTP